MDNALDYFEQLDSVTWKIKEGFVPNMRTSAKFYANESLVVDIFDELDKNLKKDTQFVPAVEQIANVATLPGIVGSSLGMPDIHSGYGFSIGNVAAFDADDVQSIVSPGGVGFDINCGVRVIRTNLMLDDVLGKQEELADAMFEAIPVGVGSRGVIPIENRELDTLMEMGVDWAIKRGYAWAEDKENCEEYGRMMNADPSLVSKRAKNRGISQLGTLGGGNHYIEVQVVEEIYDKVAARKMGIECEEQICIFIHSGSRGLGHQVASDALRTIERSQNIDDYIPIPDRQLTCARIQSDAGRDYLNSMACAANFAWVNRQCMTFLTRQAFSKVFNSTPDDLEMHLIYDVSHNIAKFEKHMVDGKERNLLVHRKGSTRAFAPHHPQIPVDYQFIGQPVLIGGTMGTSSYVLTGTEKGMQETFGSTCHGAGRRMSRTQSRKELSKKGVRKRLRNKGITIRLASPKLIMEEAPETYKDVSEVVDTCHEAGISKKSFKLRPLCVIKG
eukprot:TRINITY_DN8359_c0_g1_i1.p1 TRINITY_DN8359_c0_g1~~TRINITY_DN8359_c0_g1_i1.p1  ORF type:complete len:501 (+),score=111.25 TRINITY_DN8359_c0_g1_i1:22-1524(+)